MFCYSLSTKKNIRGGVANEMRAFSIVYWWDSPESKSDYKIEVRRRLFTRYLFYNYIRPEQLKTGMFGRIASKKYVGAVEYMLNIASLQPKPLIASD